MITLTYFFLSHPLIIYQSLNTLTLILSLDLCQSSFSRWKKNVFLTITICHYLSPLVMSNGDPRVRYYYCPPYLYGPRREKTCLQGLRQSETQTIMLSYSDQLDSLVASLDMRHSKKRTTKALIRLHGCAGWSAPLLIANP